MEFDFNDRNIGRKLFPAGCNLCGGVVQFVYLPEEIEEYKLKYPSYVCTKCGAYTLAHRETKGFGIKNYPQGILADEDLQRAHVRLRMKFNVLWQQLKINHIYPEYVLSFVDDTGTLRAGVVVSHNKETREYTLETETKERFVRSSKNVNDLDHRGKSYFWLATKLGLSIYETQIPMLDYNQSSDAVDIIDEALSSIQVQTKIKQENESND